MLHTPKALQQEMLQQDWKQSPLAFGAQEIPLEAAAGGQSEIKPENVPEVDEAVPEDDEAVPEEEIFGDSDLVSAEDPAAMGACCACALDMLH